MHHKCTLRLLNQTLNGKIFKCSECNKIHIEYKNLNFVFEREEFEFFRNYFLELVPEHWEKRNRNSVYNRKILVPIGHKNFTAMFSAEEIHEIKSMMLNMFKGKKEMEFIKLDKLSGKFNLN